MTTSTGAGPLELVDYVGVLRRRRWVVLVAVCVGLLAGGVVVALVPKAYTASASVYVAALASENNQATGTTTGTVDMDDQAQIVQSQAVAQTAANLLGHSLSAQAVRGALSVSVPANTTVLDIDCTASKRARAAACADDVAAAYLTARLTSAASVLRSTLAGLQAKSTSLAQEIGTLTATLDRPSTAARHISTQLELNGANAQLNALASQIDAAVPELASLQAPHDTLAGHLLSAAAIPAGPSTPRAQLLLPSGLLAGLIVGLLAAFLADWRDGRLHDSRDVERFLGLPVLLSLAGPREAIEARLLSPRSAAGEAFAELAQYAAVSLGEGSHVLLLVAVSSGSAASVIAANLAAALARARGEVLLVCAAPSETLSAQLLGAGDGRGLAELLAASAAVSELARPASGLDGVRVIAPGVDDAGALLDRQGEVSRLMVELRAQARYVIIQAPPIGERGGALSFAELADSAIVVIEASRTRRAEAVECLRRLQRIDTPILGAAVVAASEHAERASAAPAATDLESLSARSGAGSPPAGASPASEQRGAR